jgi:hypothetical protein
MYLEQRIQKLEEEVEYIKTKLTSSGNDNIPTWEDTMYNPSVTLLSIPDLDTSFASPFETTSVSEDHLDTFVLEITSKNHPEYPNIWGSWEELPNLEGGLK